jgi:hypothetical protein
LVFFGFEIGVIAVVEQQKDRAGVGGRFVEGGSRFRLTFAPGKRVVR